MSKSLPLSALIYAAIPAVLGLGAGYWLVFAGGLHAFDRQLSQEKRHAVVVGAPAEPTAAPMQIILKRGPVVADRVEIDGHDLYVWYRNVSNSRQTYISLTWSLKAPDGTIVKSGGGYTDIFGSGAGDLDPGERAEAHYKTEPDPRAVSVTIRFSSQEQGL